MFDYKEGDTRMLDYYQTFDMKTSIGCASAFSRSYNSNSGLSYWLRNPTWLKYNSYKFAYQTNSSGCGYNITDANSYNMSYLPTFRIG